MSFSKIMATIYLEGAHQCLVYTHHAPGIVKLPAVVGGGEQGDQLPLGEKLVPILHDLRSVTSVSIFKISCVKLWKLKC